MATEKRLIDANALKIHRMHNAGANHPLDVVYRKDIDNAPTVDAVELDKCNFKLHHILIDNEGVPEVKIQIGDRYFIMGRHGSCHC